MLDTDRRPAGGLLNSGATPEEDSAGRPVAAWRMDDPLAPAHHSFPSWDGFIAHPLAHRAGEGGSHGYLDPGPQLIDTSPRARPEGRKQATQLEGMPRADAAPRRVLVVEDNRDGLETLVALLDLLGYEVAGAADGREALEQASRFHPHVVLLDLGLPVMDGLEVARKLRADERFRGVFIAALTGWGAESDRRRTAEAGFDAHLTKPVEFEALQALLAGTEKSPKA